MKNTFIPPSHRPQVRGTQLQVERDETHSFDIYCSPIKRREKIFEILTASESTEHAASEECKVLLEFFPEFNSGSR